MPTFDITAPDGKVYEIEGANAQGALQALQKHLGAAPQPTAQQAATAMASQPAADVAEFDATGAPTGMRMQQPVQAAMPYGEQMRNVGRSLDNGMRLAANGMTFGLADKLAGGMNSLTGRAATYDEGVKAERATTQAIRDANPMAAGAAEMAGGLVGGVGLMKSGATLAGRVGSGLLPRILGFGAEGAAYGAAHGAGNTYSNKLTDYVDNAKSGAFSGALIGGGLPLAGAVAGGLYRTGSAFLGPRVEGVGRGASSMLRAAAQADEAGLQGLSKMGPDAMLVDAGPSMMGLGQGAGTGTGAGRSKLVNALRTRDAQTGPRLAKALDDNLGPAPIPSRVEAQFRGERQALSPEYEAAFNNAKAADTGKVIEAIDSMIPNVRGQARTELMRVRDDLHITDAAGNTGVPDPHPRALFAVRRSIDGASSSATDSNVRRVLGDVRKLVDAELTAKVPGIKAADAKFSGSMQQSEALERGQSVFETGRNAVRPAELVDELAGYSPGQISALRQGTRAELDRVVGTQVNDLNALERTLATPHDWNSQKFGAVFGEGPKAKVAEALMNNRRFRESYQNIVQNSQTAQRTEAAAAMKGGEGGNVPTDTTLTGLGLKALNAVAKAISGASNASTKDEIGRILASQGPAVQKIARQLLESAQTASANSRTLSRVLSSPRLIGAGSPEYGRQPNR